MKNALTPYLWLAKEAKEALQFYSCLHPNSRMGTLQRDAADSLFGTKKGHIMTASATIMGQDFMAIDGGPMLPQTEAAFFQIQCDTREEVDNFWGSLIAGGGKAG